MKRRDFIKVSATALAGSALVRNKSGFTQETKTPPNIIFIMADDMGYGDLGCYGQKHIKTPRIDRLAAEGLRFTQAYAGGPVCTPSRCSLMTGMHNGHSAARDNIPHYHTYLQENDVTVAEVLKQAGYKCGGVGKWSLGDAGTVGRATNQGFDRWFGYLNQDHAHYYYTEYLDDNDARLELTGNAESHAHYSHDLMAEQALQFIRENKDAPFFFYGAFTIPHFASKDEDPHGLAVPSTVPYTKTDWDERSKKYAAMIDRLDKDVGRIVELVEELGLTDNTMIIFTSDNGGHFDVAEFLNTSGPLRGFKRDLTEGGIRVPFIVRWPGKVPAGATSDEIITFWDMLPTFAELAGVKAPDGIDGIAVADALKGGSVQHPHDYLYWDYGHCRDRYDQAVRMGNWKGIRHGRDGKIQIYDLATDIGETNDVAEEQPKVVKKIAAIMETAVKPNPRYPVGKPYHGEPIWKKEPAKQ